MLTEWMEPRTEWEEHDGKVWNVMERPEWCQNDVRALEMDLAKFYMTGRGVLPGLRFFFLTYVLPDAAEPK